MIYQPFENNFTDYAKFVNLLVFAGVFSDRRLEAADYVLDLLMLELEGLTNAKRMY